MSDDLHIGSRLPAYCTSIGRVLLAYMPAEQLEQYLARVVLIPYTTRTVSSVDKLRLALRNVRRHGYAMVEPGVRGWPALSGRSCILAHGTRGGDGEPERKRAAHVAVRDADAYSAAPAQCGDGTGSLPALGVWLLLGGDKGTIHTHGRDRHCAIHLCAVGGDGGVHGDGKRLALIGRVEAPAQALRREATLVKARSVESSPEEQLPVKLCSVSVSTQVIITCVCLKLGVDAPSASGDGLRRGDGGGAFAAASAPACAALAPCSGRDCTYLRRVCLCFRHVSCGHLSLRLRSPGLGSRRIGLLLLPRRPAPTRCRAPAL